MPILHYSISVDDWQSGWLCMLVEPRSDFNPIQD